MKKYVLMMLVAVAMLMVTSCNREKKQSNDDTFNTSVEELIHQDEAYFKNMAGKVQMYECRIVMPKAFCESDRFIALEVTNVFQQTIEDGKGGVDTNVYMFTHLLNSADVNVQMHKGAFVLDDKPLDKDSIKVTFDEAFRNAKMSNYTPSRSRYITLRRAIAPLHDRTYYIIGNDAYGQMLVDAQDGTVTDKEY